MKLNSTKVLVVAKYFYDDSMLKTLLKQLKKFSKLDVFFFKNSERPRSISNKINQRFSNKIKHKNYEIVIVWNNILLDEEIELLKKSKIIGILNGFTCLNSYQHEKQIDFFDMLKKYDFYLVSQKNYVTPLRSQGVNAIHFNFFSDPTIYKPLKINNLMGIGFIGNVDDKWSKNRFDSIKFIKKKLNQQINVVSNINMKFSGIRNLPKLRSEFLVNLFFNLNKVNLSFDYLPSTNPYNHMKNIIIPYKDKFVSRVRNFNILLSRSALIVENYENILELFEDDLEIVTWNNADELCEKVQKLLKDNNFRLMIEKNGYLKCLNNHTIFHRMTQIEKILEKKIFDFKLEEVLKRVRK